MLDGINMNTTYDFKKDLALGKRGEYFVLGEIRGKYPMSQVVNRQFKGYDIYVPETKTKIECKFDRLSIKTGCVAIEYEYKGSPSGIDGTDADVWALIFYDKDSECWVWGFIAKESLKHLCNTRGKEASGGQNRHSNMYLLNTKHLVNSIYMHLKTVKK